MSILNAYTKDNKIINVNSYTDEHKGKVFCGEGHPVIAKRGEKKVWHYSHKGKDGKGCPFAKGPWHIWSQARIKPEYIEKRIKIDNKYHICDVLTPDGIVIEFQNSTMCPKEIKKREQFYTTHAKGMIWVFNAQRMDLEFVCKHGDLITMTHTYGTGYWKYATQKSFLDQGKQGYLEISRITGSDIECKVWTMKEFDDFFLQGITVPNCDMRKERHVYDL